MPRRRSQFLINKHFQLRYCLYVCSWIMGLTLVYPLLISSLFDNFIENAMQMGDMQLAETVKLDKAEATTLLIWLQVALVGIVLLMSFFLSHRIAGPLYKLKQYFESGRSGTFLRNLSFRKHDHFKDVAESYNHFMSGVDAHIAEERKKLDSAVASLEKGDKDAALTQLKSLQKTLEL